MRFLPRTGVIYCNRPVYRLLDWITPIDAQAESARVSGWNRWRTCQKTHERTAQVRAS